MSPSDTLFELEIECYCIPYTPSKYYNLFKYFRTDLIFKLMRGTNINIKQKYLKLICFKQLSPLNAYSINLFLF